MQPTIVFPPRTGYDLAAPLFPTWHWRDFWRANEAPFVRDWLRRQPIGRGLDAGSGGGSYNSEILSSGHSCASVDISDGMLRLSASAVRRRKTRDRLLFVQADIETLPFAEGRFDWILCTRVMGHIADLDGVLAELLRVLRPGGEILITDIHPRHPYEYTRIAGLRDAIAIRTYKHSMAAIRRAVRSLPTAGRFELTEVRSRDLPHRIEGEEFEKLYQRPDTPISYRCLIGKRDG